MKHRTSFLILFAFTLLLLQREVWGQSIPNMIPHSGTVTVNGTPFNGTGQFKFAIIDAEGAAASISWWSNDFTSTAGSEPTAAVGIPVTNGVFSVKLGDDTLENMDPIQTAVFNNNSVAFLRVWFSDGATGFQQLSPDRQLVSVPFAYKAATVDPAGMDTSQLLHKVAESGQIFSGLLSGRYAANAGFIIISDSYPVPLPAGTAAPILEFVPGTPTATCPGAGQAPAGRLCVYAYNNVNIANAFLSGGSTGVPQRLFGFSIDVIPTTAASAGFFLASWAYRVP
ncbi:MAG: hypothetical protein MPW14_02645 [Candidatus Manganitrophus sp.]|nr:hypothetical protein [Candidatus Manganitrophus sp.]WDT71902.1 MAG: hypothetical protein MPW17_03395 [Candidatus Manganitrophus sp.]WDT80705.1 MAG: hypothetical protein MPW14_02645 [Candidatus Manganitrophus sp.]